MLKPVNGPIAISHRARDFLVRARLEKIAESSRPKVKPEHKGVSDWKSKTEQRKRKVKKVSLAQRQNSD